MIQRHACRTEPAMAERNSPLLPQHPRLTRRTALEAGAVSLLGLGLNHVTALRALAATEGRTGAPPARSVIYIFLSGGLSQLESFDLKPDAPEEIRGEFKPIETSTPGIRICEHLPMLAQRSKHWALVRSLTHPSNDHSTGHHIMLTGRSEVPPGFDPSRPKPGDFPAIAAVAGAVTRPRNNLPPAVVLPEKLVHYSGRVLPGQFGGMMGNRRDPWFIEASRFDPRAYGAFPDFDFDHQDRPRPDPRKLFQAPSLSLPEGVGSGRLANRLSLLQSIDRQREDLGRVSEVAQFDRWRQEAVSLLTDGTVRRALDLDGTDPRILERYGRNSFGWSLLMAKRLVESGVNLVQVNLGNNETWDTHGNAFPHLKDQLLPPTDRALSALLDDLHDTGLLDSTLIVMAGEFGRTPKISGLPQFYKLPGRDHWGAAQSVFFAGGGVKGGQVIGSTDATGGFPQSDAVTPEQMAATIYQALGLPQTASWEDQQSRPNFIYYGEPIPKLTG